MRIPVILLVLVVMGGIAGCATGPANVNKGEEWLANSRKCISSLDQIVYEKIDMGQFREFAFDEETTVLQEGERRRFVKGFALPSGSGAYTVSITSYKEGTTDEPAIMYPETWVLDKDYRVIRTLSKTDFVYRRLGSREGLNSVLFINHNAQGESFLLITNRLVDEAELEASHSNTERMVPVVVPFPGGFAMWLINTSTTSPPIKMRASAIGQLEVEIRAYRLKKVGEKAGGNN